MDKFHSTPGNEAQGDLLQSSPLDGGGAGRRHWDGNIGKRRSAEEGQTIAHPQHLYNPRLRIPVPPGLPMEGQTTAGKGPERRWFPPPETRRAGRRSPPPPPPPPTPLKR